MPLGPQQTSAGWRAQARIQVAVHTTIIWGTMVDQPVVLPSPIMSLTRHWGTAKPGTGLLLPTEGDDVFVETNQTYKGWTKSYRTMKPEQIDQGKLETKP